MSNFVDYSIILLMTLSHLAEYFPLWNQSVVQLEINVKSDVMGVQKSHTSPESLIKQNQNKKSLFFRPDLGMETAAQDVGEPPFCGEIVFISFI